MRGMYNKRWQEFKQCHGEIRINVFLAISFTEQFWTEVQNQPVDKHHWAIQSVKFAGLEKGKPMQYDTVLIDRADSLFKSGQLATDLNPVDFVRGIMYSHSKAKSMGQEGSQVQWAQACEIVDGT